MVIMVIVVVVVVVVISACEVRGDLCHARTTILYPAHVKRVKHVKHVKVSARILFEWELSVMSKITTGASVLALAATDRPNGKMRKLARLAGRPHRRLPTVSGVEKELAPSP